VSVTRILKENLMTKTKEDCILKPKTTFGKNLRFTPYAWAKLIWMRDRGDTEVAGYGITATPDPLLITDFVLVKQNCTSVEFHFDKDDSAEHIHRMMDIGLPPWSCSNILIHTHPGNSPKPSLCDEENFRDSFSHPHWAIMFILAQEGETYCRLKFNIGPGANKEIVTTIDWKTHFRGCNVSEWEEEYKKNVFKMKKPLTIKKQIDSYEDIWSNLLVDQVSEEQNIGEEEYEVFREIDGTICVWDEEDEEYYCYRPQERVWFANDTMEMKHEEINKKPWLDFVIDWINKNPQKNTNEALDCLDI